MRIDGKWKWGEGSREMGEESMYKGCGERGCRSGESGEGNDKKGEGNKRGRKWQKGMTNRVNFSKTKIFFRLGPIM